MKTLVFFGSARKDGYTKIILDKLIQKLAGDIEVIDIYRDNQNISPCVDCRYCWEKPECRIKDDMQQIYSKITDADNIIIASPVYFHCITGPLKSVIDRLQVYWASAVRGDKLAKKNRKGGYLLVGGAPKFENQFLAAKIVCDGVLEVLNANCCGEIIFANSDRVNPAEEASVNKQIEKLATALNN